MNDISTETDIKLLVNEFYKKVVVNPTIGFIFNEVAHFSWEEHIPIMYSFWGSMLLGSGSYERNPMGKHMELDKLLPLTKNHFDQWLKLWEETLRENFEGEKADEALTRAKNIAGIMLHKIEQSRFRN